MAGNAKTADEIREDIIEVLRNIHDPEIPVNIYDMGLIYEVAIDEKGATEVTMTLTSPSCPVAESLPVEVEQKVGNVPGVTQVKVDLVWEPQWTPDKMTEAARLDLGLL
jgi:FeS assembly SUF system protein